MKKAGVGNGIGVFDIDHCFREDGTLNDTAATVLSIFPTAYVEKSPSGKGLRGFFGVPVGVSEKETRAFWDFYKNIALSEEQLQYWVDESCVVPLTSMINNSALYEGDGKAGLRVAVEALRNGTYSGQAAFAKNDSQVWEIINQQVLARVTMTQDPIDQICSQAQTQIEALLK